MLLFYVVLNQYSTQEFIFQIRTPRDPCNALVSAINLSSLPKPASFSTHRIFPQYMIIPSFS